MQKQNLIRRATWKGQLGVKLIYAPSYTMMRVGDHGNLLQALETHLKAFFPY